MKPFEELIQTETFWTTKIQNELYGMIRDHLKEEDKTQKELAEELGVSKGYISQIMNGEFDHKLSKLVKLSLALGKAPIIQFKNIDELPDEEEKAKDNVHDKSL